MVEAIALAKAAAALGEVPVGAVVIADGRIIGRGHNLRESTMVSTRHAEIVAIEEACKTVGSWRPEDCDLVVTLEPCLMCAGAIYQSRIRRVVFATPDPQAGALGSLYEIHKDVRLNHRFVVDTGVLAEPCSALLKDFFAARR